MALPKMLKMAELVQANAGFMSSEDGACQVLFDLLCV
jgi:hypothetical protein